MLSNQHADTSHFARNLTQIPVAMRAEHGRGCPQEQLSATEHSALAPGDRLQYVLRGLHYLVVAALVFAASELKMPWKIVLSHAVRFH